MYLMSSSNNKTEGWTPKKNLLLASIDLVPQLPPKTVKEEFNIQTYSGGHLLKGGNKGGFI